MGLRPPLGQDNNNNNNNNNNNCRKLDKTVLTFAPTTMGGWGFERAYTVASAALIDEINRALSGKDGEPSRHILEALIAWTAHGLGFEPSVEEPTPLEWWPMHLKDSLDEELIGQAWFKYRLETGLRARHSGMPTRGALNLTAWPIDYGRVGVPRVWEDLKCTLSTRLCGCTVELAIVRQEAAV